MPAPDLDTELETERTHLSESRAALRRMRGRAEALFDAGSEVAGDPYGAEALGRTLSRRVAELADDPSTPLFFGRLDIDETAYHVGRRHVTDDAGEPMVLDWRAPLSRSFYRASVRDPQGVATRRRFGFVKGELTSFEDEHLDRGEELGTSSRILTAEIERPRVGPMRDIVATIQPEQDELVRADLDSSVCVQGAPGTGKTAVGLHRAAFLLYLHRERLRRSGVLVVGPNAAFLHYIAQVLPSLGEGGIEQATVDALVGVAARGDEPVGLATLKGDPRLADVLRRAVTSHVRKPTDDVLVTIGTRRYRVGEYRLRRYVDDARRALADGLRWSVARDRLRMQIAEDIRRQREDGGGAPSDAETAKVARAPGVKEFVDAVWPALTATGLLARLYDDPAFLAKCAPSLTEDERAALHRPAPKTLRSVKWTPSDTVLLDELNALLEGVDTFVHVVVDEAQDLSPMQCRAVARRCPQGSITVLGDLAQATTAWAPGDWAVTLEHLGHPEATVRPLTAGYRVPGEVIELANRLLPHVAVGVPPGTAVRAGVDALRFGATSALFAEVSRCLEVEGSVGVIVPDAAVADALSTLAPLGAVAISAESDDDVRVTVVPASAAKGLEYDSVVLLEPSAIAAAEPTRPAGLRRLYVVLTRAVSRLVVLHDEPLPPELAA